MATFEDSLEPQKDYPKLGDDILQFFAYEHLKPEQQVISKAYFMFASELTRRLPQCPERTVALRKLLESKDASVRATLWKPAS